MSGFPILAAALWFFSGPPSPDDPAAVPVPAQAFALRFQPGPAWDAAKSPGAQPHMKEHSENLLRLKREGRILLGGRFGKFGLVVISAASEEAARAELSRDPSIAAGVFTVEVDPWSTIFDGCAPERPKR